MIKNKSFTLIELLVVIVIIGILAGVIMISTSSSISKANIAKLKVFEESVSNNLTANMVSRWKLDGNTNDSWGVSNGTPANITYGQGHDGTNNGAAIFNGTSGYINCGNNGSLNFGLESFSVSVWFKTTEVSGNYQIMKYTDTNWWGFYSNSSIQRFQLYSGVGQLFTTATPTGVWNDNSWHYYIGVINRGNNTLTLYRDGLPGTPISISGYGTATNTGNLTLGGWGSFSYFYNGLMDEVRLYNAAISSSQIKQNYIAGLDSLLSKGGISKEDYNQRVNALAYEN